MSKPCVTSENWRAADADVAGWHFWIRTFAMVFDTPRLIAEIDGEFARFALESSRHQFVHKSALRCADQLDFQSAVATYLSTIQGPKPKHAAIAIANPVDGDAVRMTNYHWQFSIEAVRQGLALDTLLVVNDFTALAMAVPGLSGAQRRQIGSGAPRVGSVMGVIGAGTGLGVSGLIPASEGWVALGAEGGHASFAPRDAREVRILQHAWSRHSHVSFERLISASGIELMFEALALGAPQAGQALSANDIITRALANACQVCQEVIDVFCALLGTAAGNLAVTLGAKGGIYVGGSIAPRLGARLDHSRFRERFEDKGRFTDYLHSIPTFVITASDASFDGAATVLDSQLRELDSSSAAILQRIQQGLPSLSPAERRVAEHVLAHPRKAMSEPIAEIALASGVSQPTVIRFCRSLGCEGLSDFKLKLASGMSATLPITHAQVRSDDGIVEVGMKVLGNTASAILQERDKVNWDAFAQAVARLERAKRIDIHAIGHAAAVAIDAQYKFMRMGVPCAAYTDQRLQLLAANAMSEGDVLLVISSAGRVAHLLAVCDQARARGAQVLAVTASNSPLAKKADLALTVDHAENLDTHVAMVSRILQLLVIDVLAVSLAASKPLADAAMIDAADEDSPSSEGAPQAAQTSKPPKAGVRTAHTLANITSHGI